MASIAEQGWPPELFSEWMTSIRAPWTPLSPALSALLTAYAAVGVPGPGCMAAITNRVDGGRQHHEGAGLHEGDHPSGRGGGGSSTHDQRCCPPTLVRRWDILQGHQRPAGSGVSGRAAAGCGARPPCVAVAMRDAADQASHGGATAGCGTRPFSTAAAAGDAPADAESGGGLGSGCL
jgi:hypothetical protein